MTHLTTHWQPGSALALALALALAMTLPAGCSTTEPAKPAAVPSTIQGPGRPSVAVSAESSGAAVVLERGQELIVRLPAEASVVAAGLEWAPVDLKPGVLTPLGSTFERALRNTNFQEAAGSVVWRFRAEAAGSVALKFDLRRPHRLDPAVQTVHFAVTVK